MQSNPPRKQTTPKDEIEAFQTEYLEWYTDCLSKLEGELKDQFQLIYQAYAKSFVLHPTDVQSGRDGGYSSLVYSYIYPYRSNFQKSAFEHKTILLQANKMQKLPASEAPAEAFEVTDSMTNLKPDFKSTALKHIAKIIESRFKIDYFGTGNELLMLPDTMEMNEFFKRAGYNIDSLNSSEGTIYKWLKGIQNMSDGQDRIYRIIKQLCDPQEYFGEEKQFQAILKQVNQVLQHYSLVAAEDGRILHFLPVKNSVLPQSLLKAARSLKGREAELFDSRKFHAEITKHGRTHFIEGRYLQAVIECCKAFEKRVREKAKLNKHHGQELMGAALSPKTGYLKLNTLQTVTEENEQEGLMYLCKGLMQAIRNPGSHEPEIDRQMTKEDALEQLSLISYLYRQIDKTQYVVSEKANRHS